MVTRHVQTNGRTNTADEQPDNIMLWPILSGSESLIIGFLAQHTRKTASCERGLYKNLIYVAFVFELDDKCKII